MRRVFYIFLLLLLAQVGMYAQSGSPALRGPCPDIDIKCPAIFGYSKEPVTITAFVSGGDPSVKPYFTWTFSGGKIMSGQGTSTIIVDVVGEVNFLATVKIGGFLESCNVTASCSFGREWPPSARRFDEYAKIGDEDEMARLDNFAIELNYNPRAIGYLIAYGGRRAYVNEARARLERAKDYLVNSRVISKDRIVIIDGGNREEFIIELYIAPLGAAPPVASPTVKPEEVQIIKSAPGKTRRHTSRH